MSSVEAGTALSVEAQVLELLRRRTDANLAFFEAHAERLAEVCHRMAERFSRGGRLLALGAGGAGRSDARHVAVEFVHPVIVGKRALPALGLARDGGPLESRFAAIARPVDMVLAVVREGAPAGEAAEVKAALEAARRLGCLTIDTAGADAEWSFGPDTPDPFVRQELAETLYHLLWELVHVFFEHPGLLEGRGSRQVHDPGAASFLYPFLSQEESDLEAVLGDVAASVRMKAREVGELRERTVEGQLALVAATARMLRHGFDRGATLLAMGNGGSATDAMDLVADLREPPGGWPPRPALDLTEDAAILTALGNDVGIETVFSRQVMAYGREGDLLVAFSTSGGSGNVLRALEEGRRRGLRSMALVGYDGGRIAEEGLADVVLAAPSEYVPRIQEAHATVAHILREVLEAEDAGHPVTAGRPVSSRARPPAAGGSPASP